MLHTLLTLLFPPKPQRTPSIPLLSGLIPVRVREVDLRAQGVMYLDEVRAAASYASSKNLQDVIRQYKYNRKRALAAPLGQLLCDALEVFPPDEEAILCPVPLHWSRRFSRGFNQAELLAASLSQEAGLPHTRLLHRVRPTGHQAWRTHDERRLAMHDAFIASPCDHLHVTLVDDVATTMSTLDACARALKSAGATHVDAIVIALG